MKLAGRVRGLLEMMNEADRASEAHIRWDNYAKLPGWNVSVPLFDGSISMGALFHSISPMKYIVKAIKIEIVLGLC